MRVKRYVVRMGKREFIQDFGVETWWKENIYRRRWNNNIEMNVKGIVRESANCFYLAQLTGNLWNVVHKVMDIRGPLKEWNILASCGSVSFWGKTQVHEISYLVIFVYIAVISWDIFRVSVYIREIDTTHNRVIKMISPFTSELWATIVSTMFLFILIQKAVYSIGSHYTSQQERDNQLPHACLYVFGAFCQQGYLFSPFLNFTIHSWLVLGILNITTICRTEVFY